MSDSGRHDIRLADRPRMLWGTSVVTCNSGRADTSFGRQIGLPRVSIV
jgi:hypothetical protein